jgi:hypothetical protein
MSANMDVANEIYRQIGGRRFAIMTGAKQFAGDADSLRFRIMKNAKRIAIVLIRLNGLDLYDLTFYGANGQVKEKAENVFAENLESVFTGATGLYTSL